MRLILNIEILGKTFCNIMIGSRRCKYDACHELVF